MIKVWVLVYNTDLRFVDFDACQSAKVALETSMVQAGWTSTQSRFAGCIPMDLKKD